MTREIEKLEEAVAQLTSRVTLMIGGLAIVAFLVPILAPFIRDLFGVEVPPLPIIEEP